MNQLDAFPKFYFQRGKLSDRQWISEKIRYIPPRHRQEVADEYEKLYLRNGSQGRKLANEYLNGVAKEFHNELIEARKNAKKAH